DGPIRTPAIDAGIAAWHRPTGIFCACGPHFRNDGQTLAGATLFDIAPTVLHAAGLPVGRDLPGKVLTEVFARDRPIVHIGSWETQTPRHPPPALARNAMSAHQWGTPSDAPDSPSADQGGIDAPAAPARRDNLWNIAHALAHVGRDEEALAAFEEVYFHQPERSLVALPLAQCQLRLGLAEEARATLAGLVDFAGGTPEVDLLLAEL